MRNSIKLSLVFYFLFLSFIPFSVAQYSTKIDSLITDFQTNNNENQQVDSGNELAWEFLWLDSLKEANKYAKLSRQLAIKIDYQKGLGDNFMRQGAIEEQINNYNGALKNYFKALKIRQELLVSTDIGKALKNIASIYYRLGSFEEALDYYSKSLTHLIHPKNKSISANIHYRMGIVYSDMDNLTKAIEYYSQSLFFYKSVKDELKIAEVTMEIAMLLNHLKDYQKALDSLNKSLIIYKKHDKQEYIASCYHNFGTVYSNLEKLDIALSYYKKALKIYTELEDDWYSANTKNQIGLVYQKQQKYEEASQLYTENLLTFLIMPDSFNIAQTYYYLGSLFALQAKTEKAETYYNRAFVIADSIGFEDLLLEIIESYAELYAQQDRFKEAYEKQRLLKYLREKQVGEAVEVSAEIGGIQANHEVLVTKEQLQLSKEKRAVLEKVVLYVLLGAFFILIISMIWGYRERINKLKANQEIDNLLIQQENNVFLGILAGIEEERRRIAADLHDRLGSVLSTVKLHLSSIGILKMEENAQFKKANSLLDKACDEVRQISHQMASNLLTTFGLIAALEDLTNTINDSKKIEVELSTFGIYERFEQDKEIEIFRIIQELVNNALKHAKASELTIELTYNENLLNIIVEDNGVGFNPHTVKKGLGMKSINTRVHKIQGKWNIDSGKGGGTVVIIDINV